MTPPKRVRGTVIVNGYDALPTVTGDQDGVRLLGFTATPDPFETQDRRALVEIAACFADSQFVSDDLKAPPQVVFGPRFGVTSGDITDRLRALIPATPGLAGRHDNRLFRKP